MSSALNTAPSPHLPPPTPGGAAAPPAIVGRIDAKVLVKGAILGIVAIASTTLIAMWANASGGQPAVSTLRLLTTPFGGESALQDGNALVGIGINTLIGAVLGVVFVFVAKLTTSSRDLLIAGLVFGAGVFLVDRYVLSQVLSDALTMREGPFELAVRMLLGTILALGFMPHRSRA